MSPLHFWLQPQPGSAPGKLLTTFICIFNLDDSILIDVCLIGTAKWSAKSANSALWEGRSTTSASDVENVIIDVDVQHQSPVKSSLPHENYGPARCAQTLKTILHMTFFASLLHYSKMVHHTSLKIHQSKVTRMKIEGFLVQLPGLKCVI